MTIAEFVKARRKKLGMTQVTLADRAGVGFRFVRNLEQGKTTLRLDKVNQALQMFGHCVGVTEEELSDILVRYKERLTECGEIKPPRTNAAVFAILFAFRKSRGNQQRLLSPPSGTKNA